MSAASIANAIQDTGLFTAMRESALVYPIILSLHLTCIAIFGGMIMVTDLRLLGLVMKTTSVTDVVSQLRVWKRIGFVIMISCGIMLGGAKFGQYYDNPYFQLKMFLLALVGVHAIVFHKSVYANTKAIDRAPSIPGVAKVAACLSLALWLGIMSCGRWIAYFEKPEDKGPVQKTSLIDKQLTGRRATATGPAQQSTAGRKS
ncbi:MAG TPA: DUF6644 family protein [Bryobacteraceae bacterium]|jgi:hypothetical protein|nr:DUF6644 family protein [Bryobacteraceae bacterium]